MVGSSSSSACGVAEERLREQDAHLLAALQFAHRARVQIVRNVQPLEQNGRVALGRVPVLLADDALEFPEPHAVVVGHVEFGVEPLAFLERGPQPRVAHDDGVDDAEGVEGELVLLEDAQSWEARRPCRLAA